MLLKRHPLKMLVKILHARARLIKGSVLNFPDDYAKELIEKGLAEKVKSNTMPETNQPKEEKRGINKGSDSKP